MPWPVIVPLPGYSGAEAQRPMHSFGALRFFLHHLETGRKNLGCAIKNLTTKTAVYVLVQILLLSG